MSNFAQPANVSEIAQECIAAIRVALKQFGEYPYYDKGADEVIDVSRFVSRLEPMDGRTVGQILQEVLAFEHGRPFCSAVVHGLDEGWPEAKWNAMMAVSAEVADLY